MKSIIEIRNLSKKYTIREYQPYYSLRDSVTDFIKNPLSALKKNAKKEDFWALKNVSISVSSGEVVGIIGKNGAGKSTLLKILSRIVTPTKGEAWLKGRVASLLEIGTGFHSELTGRENIFLNGAILGMKRREIEKKFDDIVEFSDVSKFIDTPVKHYSSGMHVRLAFSVAAHLESDILLVDEVLAVGDAQFQKKCLGKIQDIKKQGRTVLFVSHNMQAVLRLCQRVIVLDKGQKIVDDDVNNAVRAYLKTNSKAPAKNSWVIDEAPGDSVAKLKGVRVLNSSGKISERHDIRKEIILEMEYWALEEKNLFTVFSFYNDQGILLFASPSWDKRIKKPGIYQARCTIPGNLLTEGTVSVVAEVSTMTPFYQKHILEYDAVFFQVVDKGMPGSVREGWGQNIPGVMRPKLEWEETKIKQ